MHPNSTSRGVRNMFSQFAGDLTNARTSFGDMMSFMDPAEYSSPRSRLERESAENRRRSNRGTSQDFTHERASRSRYHQDRDRPYDSRGLSPPRRDQDRRLNEGLGHRPSYEHYSKECCFPRAHASNFAHGANSSSAREPTNSNNDESPCQHGARVAQGENIHRQHENCRHQDQRAQQAQWDSYGNTGDGRERSRHFGEMDTADYQHLRENDQAREGGGGRSDEIHHRHESVETSEDSNGSSSSEEGGHGHSTPPYSPPNAPSSSPLGSPPYSPPESPPYSPPEVLEDDPLDLGGHRALANSSEATPNAGSQIEYVEISSGEDDEDDETEEPELPMGQVNDINEAMFPHDADEIWEEIDSEWEQDLLTGARRRRAPKGYYKDGCFRRVGQPMTKREGKRKANTQNTNTAQPCPKRGRDYSAPADDRPIKRSRERSLTPSWGRFSPRSSPLLHSLGAQVAPRRQEDIRAEKCISNYVPEAIGIVRDPLDRVFRSPVQAEILSDRQLTCLALDHCPVGNLLFTSGMGLSRGLSPSSAGGMEDIFALEVVIYHNGQGNLKFYSLNLLETRHSCTHRTDVVSKSVDVLETSELRRENRAHEYGASRSSGGPWSMDDFLQNPPAAGMAGSEYAENQTVLQFLASRFQKLDHFKFVLNSAGASGPIIFALRSVYRALTNSDCIVTARLYRNGREVSQCGMSALEDKQRKEVEEEENGSGRSSLPVRRNPYAYGHICSIGAEEYRFAPVPFLPLL